MIYCSILYRELTDRPTGEPATEPPFFRDLNLDQVVAAITVGREQYDLRPFFYAPLTNIEAIIYRHQVMQDLQHLELFEKVKAFAQGMRSVRDALAQAEKLRHPLQKHRSFLDAAQNYCNTVTRLAGDLSQAPLASRGLRGFRKYLTSYANSSPFTALRQQTKALSDDFSAIVYGILIQGLRVDVRLPKGELDYSAEVLATFERFKQDAVESHKFDFSDAIEVNQIEGQILDRVGQLFKNKFIKLETYCIEHKEFQDRAIVNFDREVQFYLAFVEYVSHFKQARLSFCYPHISQTHDQLFDYEGFDLALAGKLVREGATPVCNDFHIRGPERIIVVSGPNQGGKTTFARTFGQLHYLASLGCPVPGQRAQLYLFDNMFTHFDRGENASDLRGKLQDDLVRIHKILGAATPRSIIIVNEIFASTTLRDAIGLSKKIAATIIQLGLYCVWVTFISELASLGERTVSMTSTVVPENPVQRTYKILRRPAEGLAYAMSIAEKYGLTYDMIKERVR
ncbi:MAG TPA: DNA mismatch repair protein MutS [Bradyrhizobium sp.]|nr:DNA mismatch repair protein MutS [Bradyrhizobium sp.]